MPVFQFRCSKCFSVFEHFVSSDFNVSCVSCGSGNVSRDDETAFHPSKIFCPHEKEMKDGFSYGSLKQVLINHAEECTSPKCGGRGSCLGRCGSCR